MFRWTSYPPKQRSSIEVLFKKTNLFSTTRTFSHNLCPDICFKNAVMDVEQGALPTLYAATAPDVLGGDYFGSGGLAEMRDYPKLVSSSRRSHDPGLAQELWGLSELLTGIKFSIS